MAWTYLLRCRDGSFYVGSTRDLQSRLEQHDCGRGSAYTACRLPVQLVWSCEFERIDDAWAAERRIHGWSRAKKLALIEGRLADLPELAKARAAKPASGD
jgi:predicted GIY-YIG superfamily endonuclease